MVEWFAIAAELATVATPLVRLWLFLRRRRRLVAVRSWIMGRVRMPHQVPEPTDDDLARIRKLLRRIGGEQVVWGAQQLLDVWVVEQRARLDQQMAERIRTASWVLVAATFGLVICTAGLIWATLAA